MPENSDGRTPAQEPAGTELQGKFDLGMALHQQGRLADAERIYLDVLQQQPHHFDALHLLGVISLQTRRPEQGAELIGEAIKTNPQVAAAHSNMGTAMMLLQRFEEALAAYDKAIALKPDYAEAHNDRGAALRQLKRHEEALASYDKAVAFNPNHAEAHYNRGLALSALQRRDEALASYDKAVALKPDHAEAHYNRGLALSALQRRDEALASYGKAVALKPGYAEAHYDLGNVLNALKRYQEALASYDKAIALKRDFVDAYYIRSIALLNLRRPEEALASCDKVIELRADYAEAHNVRGKALDALARHEEAVASYDKAIALKEDFAETHFNRGDALRNLRRYQEAIASFERAIALQPDQEYLRGYLVFTKLSICDWDNFELQCGDLLARVDRGEKATTPFLLFAVSNSPELQRKAAEAYVRTDYPRGNPLPAIGKLKRRDKIRIGYFSADFRNHAGAYSMVELFERHDRSKFEIIAFSFSSKGPHELKSRLEAAFDKYIDVYSCRDDEIARLAREMEIDIAIDRNGYTQDCRPIIFSLRAAPLQVSYKGYPGTMGTDAIDYLIADPIVLPADHRRHYSEKIVYLPNSYQVYDFKRAISQLSLGREEAGLPRDGFVFCCFNNNYKILPGMFDRWMRILAKVEGSVLWLLKNDTSAAANLRKEAAARGINPDRIVFAERMAASDHLARHRLADLFLDTLPYNAHTTASDALWAGLPVLSQIGETFAGRVAASLLTAIGLPELITSTPQDYEALAIELAGSPEKLAAIRHKLANNRLTTPMFDTKLFTRHIEAAYTAIYERHLAGLPPDHIVIAS